MGGGVKSQISKFQIPNFFLNQVWTGSNFYGRRKVPKKIPAKICVFWNLEFEPAQKFETGGVPPCFKLLVWNAGPGSNSKFGTSLDVPNLEFEPKKNEFGTLRRHPLFLSSRGHTLCLFNRALCHPVLRLQPHWDTICIPFNILILGNIFHTIKFHT